MEPRRKRDDLPDTSEESRAITKIEKLHCTKKPPLNRRLLFDEADIEWYLEDRKILKLRELWESGFHPADIATILQLNQLSVELWLWWQAQLGMIDKREGGAHGSR